jgi:hypothetical protein
MWKSEMGAVVVDDFGSDDWTKIADGVRARDGIDVGDINKNSLFIGYRLVEAWEQGKRSPTLEKLCTAIIEFATAARKATAPAKPEAVADATGASNR